MLLVPQMVAHVLRPATLHNHISGLAPHFAAYSPPHTPRDTARHLLLHHHRVAQLPAGEDRLLDTARKPSFQADQPQTTHGRHALGTQD